MPWQADRLVERFRRECRRVAAGRADPAELPARLWDALAEWDQVVSTVVPRLWEHVPPGARAIVASACRVAAGPDFRLLPWLREGQPMTWVELEADAELRSARVRRWAAAFDRLLAEPDADAGAFAW